MGFALEVFLGLPGPPVAAAPLVVVPLLFPPSPDCCASSAGRVREAVKNFLGDFAR